MATLADKTALQTLGELREERRWLGLGLAWGALLLTLLAVWLNARELDVPLLFFFLGIWAGVTLLAGVGLFWPVKASEADAAAVQQRLVKQRSLLGVALYVSAGLLLVLAVCMASWRGLASFAEVSSMVLLALVAGVAGMALRGTLTGRFQQEAILQWLVRNRPNVMKGLLGGGAVLLVAGAIWTFRGGSGKVWENFPEGGGLSLLGLVFVGSALWALLTNAEALTTQQMRILIMVLGGLSGLVIALMTGLRIYAWWSDVFTAGLLVWQGENSWKLWVCIYVELLGLMIMFGSLLLARADIRSNVVLRRMLYGYNSFVTGALLLAALVLLNILAYVSFPMTLEWTKTRGLQSISESSKTILENLKEPVKVYVLMADSSDFTRDVHILLDNFQAYSPRFEVKYISPDRDLHAFNELAEKYPELKQEQVIQRRQELPDDRRGLLVVCGAETGGKQPHAFIPQSNLGTTAPSDPRDKTGRSLTRTFSGEKVVMEKIQMLSEKGVKPIVYFTQFNGELEIDDQRTFHKPVEGGGMLRARLRKDNYDVRALIWGAPNKQFQGDALFHFSRKLPKDKDAVPADASLVVVALQFAVDPLNEDYPPGALDALERYLEAGGKLLVINPTPLRNPEPVILDKNGLPALLAKYGVQVGKDFLLNYNMKGAYRKADFRKQWLVTATGAPNSQSKLARPFSNQLIDLAAPKVVRAIPGGKFQAEEVLVVKGPPNDVFWVENQMEALLSPESYTVRMIGQGKLDQMRSSQPQPVAVAVTYQQKPRLVVIGDSWFASNPNVNRSGAYYDFIRSSMDWLVDRPVPVLGIAPKESGTVMVRSTDATHSERMIWLPLGLIMLLILGAGAGVWELRRR